MSFGRFLRRPPPDEEGCHGRRAGIAERKLSNARAFLAKGYSFRELAFKAIGLKVYSRILSLARHRFRARGKGVDIDHARWSTVLVSWKLPTMSSFIEVLGLSFPI